MDIDFKDMQEEISKDGERVLFIVGNGFDLAHDIHSAYGDFKKWLISTTKDSDDKGKKVYPVNIGVIWNFYYYLSKGTDMIRDNDSWNYLELMMREIDSKQIRITLETLEIICTHLNSGNEKTRFLEYALRPIRYIYVTLPNKFGMWIKGIDREIQNLEKNNYSIGSIKEMFETVKNGQFLTFNYTSTLESVYDIDAGRILHIHGRAKRGSKIIFGPDSVSLSCFKDSVEPIMKDELLRKYAAKVYSAMDGVFKDSKSIIKDNESKFGKYESIDNIVVFGHSLSEVDKLYFDKIKEEIGEKSVTWYLSFHEGEDKGQRQKFIRGLENGSKDEVKHFNMPQIQKLDN